jgi:integration host factor subunit beta
MLKSDLYERLAQRFPHLSEKNAGTAVALILAAMQDTLAGGQRIEIRGFGSFSVSTIPPRTGRNPKTGVSVLIPVRHRPHFKPGKALRERVASAPLPDAAPSIRLRA